MTIRRGKESIEQRAQRAMRDVFPGSLGGITPVADPFAPAVVPAGTTPVASSNFQVAVNAGGGLVEANQSVAGGTGSTFGTTIQSTALGAYAQTDGDYSTAVGRTSLAGGTSSVAIGEGAQVPDGANYAVAVGQGSNARQVSSIALGRGATSKSQGAIAIGDGTLTDLAATGQIVIGYGASAADSTPWAATFKADQLEVAPSLTATNETSLILHSANGSRWRVTVSDAGVLTVAAA